MNKIIGPTARQSAWTARSVKRASQDKKDILGLSIFVVIVCVGVIAMAVALLLGWNFNYIALGVVLFEVIYLMVFAIKEILKK